MAGSAKAFTQCKKKELNRPLSLHDCNNESQQEKMTVDRKTGNLLCTFGFAVPPRPKGCFARVSSELGEKAFVQRSESNTPQRLLEIEYRLTELAEKIKINGRTKKS